MEMQKPRQSSNPLLDRALDVVWNDVNGYYQGAQIPTTDEPLMSEWNENGVRKFDLEIGQSGFRSQHDADTLAASMELTLMVKGAGPANVRNQIVECFSEIANNAVQHSEANGECYGTLYYRNEGLAQGGPAVFSIGIADKGIGIRNALMVNENNLTHLNSSSDAEVIDYATQFGVTGTDENRGVGLFTVREVVEQFRGKLQIVSGNGSLTISDNTVELLDEHFLLEGTVVLLALYVPPTNS